MNCRACYARARDGSEAALTGKDMLGEALAEAKRSDLVGEEWPRSPG